MNVTKKARKMLGSEIGKGHDKCGVDGCNHDKDDVVELKPFDPIDHGQTIVPLCETHLEWARRRNKLAEEIHEEFRQHRKEIGEKYAADLNRLEKPPNGELDDAASIDQIAQITDIVRDAYSDDGVSVDDLEDAQ